MRSRKQKGGNFAEAQQVIDEWIAEGNDDDTLILNYLNLKTLPPLPNNLKDLHCAGNKLTDLPTLPDSLESLVCFDNRLRTLPKLPKSLAVLICFDNRLTTLPELPDNLETLIISDNPLPEIYNRFPGDENVDDVIHLNYIERIRKFQKAKENRLKNIEYHQKLQIQI